MKNSDAWSVAPNVSTRLASSNSHYWKLLLLLLVYFNTGHYYSLFDSIKKTVFNYKETSNFSTKHMISATSARCYSKQRVGDCK